MLLSVTTRIDSYLQFMTVLILFVFVLIITYCVTKWIARYQQGRAGSGNLEVIETCKLTSNKYVQIVRAGEKYLVIAVGKDEVHMLSEVSENQLCLQKMEQGQNADFASVFDKIKKRKENKKN